MKFKRDIRNQTHNFCFNTQTCFPDVIEETSPRIVYLSATCETDEAGGGAAVAGCRALVIALLPPAFDGKVTKFAPQKAQKFIACGKLTFDEMVVVHRVALCSAGALVVALLPPAEECSLLTTYLSESTSSSR